MTIWVIVLGLFTMSFGLLFILSPRTLIKMNEGLNKIVHEVDSQVIGNRVMVGVALLLLGLFLFYHAYSLGVR